VERRRAAVAARTTTRWLLAKYFLRLGDREVEAELEETPEGLRVNIDGNWRVVGLYQLGETQRYVMVLDDRVLEVLVGEEAQGFQVQIAGRAYEIDTLRGRRRREDEGDQFVDGRWLLRAPLTGVVSEVRVSAGDSVAQGDVLLVVEAMKMLNELRARVAGVVANVFVGEKERVEIGNPLVEVLEPEASPGL
jgi:biotin carboxyl carrier protein